ncbi:hypothetical protein BJX70DRAFT_393317 [Aspergillus crustosus]
MAPWQLDDYTTAWICALPLELAAACAMLDERHDPLPLDPDSPDNNNYVLGRIKNHNVVIACLPYGVTGTVSAATVVNQMLATFRRIKFGLMIGIGGGAPSEEHDIRLGDVVVGSPKGLTGGVIQYDFGKTVQQGRFQRAGVLNKPPGVLLTALSNLQAKHIMEGHRINDTIQDMIKSYPVMSFQYSRPLAGSDRLFQVDYDHPVNQPTCSSCDVSQLVNRNPRLPEISAQPFIHYGLIASGDQVVKHGGLRDRLRKELDVLCFEMEAAGIMDSFPCLVIRGISDYADSHKNDIWQGYAAATAAAYARELMGVIPVGTSEDQVVRVRQAGDSTTDLRFRVQEWLAPASSQDDLYRHQKDYMDGSCDWALQRPKVVSFLSSSDSQILGLGGPPGIGKSTLSAFLIHRLIQDGNPHVFYFFCKDTTGDGGSRPSHAVRTLLSQVLAADDSLRVYSLLERLRVQSGQKHAESLATLQEALQYVLSAFPETSKPFLFVIDGLDECQNGCLLASTVISALNDSNRSFKLLLASREEPDLVGLFQDYQEKSTSLQLAPLYALTIIPTGLVELYQTIFITLGKQLSPIEFHLARYLFVWMDLKDFVAVGRGTLDQEILDVVFQAANSGDEVFDSVGLAQKLCAPLITLKAVRSRRGGLAKAGMKISFSHHTTTQFVRQTFSGDDPRLVIPPVLKAQRLKALYRAKTAIWYFEQSEEPNHLLKRITDGVSMSETNVGVYFEMAYALWGAFFLRSLPEVLDEDDEAQASTLCSDLTDFLLSGRCLKWIEMAIIINYEGGFTNLFYNAMTGHTAAVESLTFADRSSLTRVIPSFRTFSSARKHFFADYAHAIACTGPTGTGQLPTLEGTDRGPLANDLMRLGKTWAHLYKGDSP